MVKDHAFHPAMVAGWNAEGDLMANTQKQRDGQGPAPDAPTTADKPSGRNPAGLGSGVPAAQGMHGMFDGKSPHAANHANADATAVQAQTGKRPPPSE
jgi:hypothetical protein